MSVIHTIHSIQQERPYTTGPGKCSRVRHSLDMRGDSTLGIITAKREMGGEGGGVDGGMWEPLASVKGCR